MKTLVTPLLFGWLLLLAAAAHANDDYWYMPKAKDAGKLKAQATRAAAKPASATTEAQTCTLCERSKARLGETLRTIRDTLTTPATFVDATETSKKEYTFPVDPKFAFITDVPRWYDRDGEAHYQKALEFATEGRKVAVRASRKGKVVAQLGHQIRIQHDDGSIATYAHLIGGCSYRIRKGDNVIPGQAIGCAGGKKGEPFRFSVARYGLDYDPRQLLGTLYPQYQTLRDHQAKKAEAAAARQKRDAGRRVAGRRP